MSCTLPSEVMPTFPRQAGHAILWTPLLFCLTVGCISHIFHYRGCVHPSLPSICELWGDRDWFWGLTLHTQHLAQGMTPAGTPKCLSSAAQGHRATSRRARTSIQFSTRPLFIDHVLCVRHWDTTGSKRALEPAQNRNGSISWCSVSSISVALPTSWFSFLFFLPPSGVFKESSSFIFLIYSHWTRKIL